MGVEREASGIVNGDVVLCHVGSMDRTAPDKGIRGLLGCAVEASLLRVQGEPLPRPDMQRGTTAQF